MNDLTRALVILGPVAVGKTTLVHEVLAGVEPGPYEEVYRWDTHFRPNVDGGVLGGHRLPYDGLLLGRIPRRPTFGATPFLGRPYLAGADQWVRTEVLPAWLINDDNGLGNADFLNALNETTDLLVILLEADAAVLEQRLETKGIPQVSVFLERSRVTSVAAYSNAVAGGARGLRLDALDAREWARGVAAGREHLGRPA